MDTVLLLLLSRAIGFAREARKTLLKAHSGERGIGSIPSHRVKRRTPGQLILSRSTWRYNSEVMAMIRDEYYSSQQKSVLQSTYATKLLRGNNNSAKLCRYFSLVLTKFMYHVLRCRTLSTSSPSVRALSTLREPVFLPVLLRIASFGKKSHNVKAAPWYES